ncbi:MAG: Rne/Rng family ribonuclease [Planctomycetota bacterium]
MTQSNSSGPDRSESRGGERSAPKARAAEFGAGLVSSAAASKPSSANSSSSRRRRGSRRGSGRAAKEGSKSTEPRSAARPADERHADERRPKASEPKAGEGEAAKKKRRSRRKKSTSSKSTADSAAHKDEREPIVGFLPAESDSPSESAAKKKTRKRGRRKSSRKAESHEDDDHDDHEVRPAASESAGSSKLAKKKRTRRRTRSKTAADRHDDEDEDEDAEERTLDADEPAPEDGESGSKKKRKRSTKKTRSKKSPEELAQEEENLRTKTILVNATDPEERRVVQVGEGGRIEDLLMTAESQKNLVNDIYRGKVVNLEPAIGAAFVDFGQGRNGFLHTSDVMPVYGEDGFTLEKLLTTRLEDDEGDPDLDDEEDEDSSERRGSKGKSSRGAKSATRRPRQRLPITDLLKVGDPVVVQVTKDAIGDKGPTLTTYISIPGRYLVLMPLMARTGVSRKIPDENERRRLKRILSQMDTPGEMGVIVRTAGVGKLKSDLERDLQYLLGVWKNLENRLKNGRGPTPLYQESDVATRTLRDLFGKETKEVVVDDFAVHEQMVDFADRLMPEHRHRIQRYEGQRPIFHHFGIEPDFEQIFNRRVELPSGGSIVFDQAEALVAIDINSGRTRTGGHDFEEIALKTNLEAVPEIALQIRLRDLGGIIVIDFIDMMKSSSNRAVERALRNELAKDRARSKLGRIGQFGLLEMTRQRLGPGTHKKVFQACPRCRGTGRIRTVQSRAQAILRRLGSALTQKGFSTIEVRAHPEVVEYTKEQLWDYVRALEHRFERELRWTAVTDQPEDSVLRYLRADGREVRPGGRRKR